jgi:tRNA(Ile)-lysidine synthase
MHPFETQLQIDWPRARWRDLTVLAAVSGGADSVALLRGLVALGRGDSDEKSAETATPDTAPTPTGRLLVAHFHHGLRGREADADMQFVVDLCQQLGVQCIVGRAGAATSNASEPSESESPLEPQAPSLTPAASEAASRDARYRFLIATAEQVGARYVALAHTADDQAETVLHHIVRGTGLAGLGGMPRARELADGIALVRPLLTARRAAARAYLADLGQAFREDSSNANTAYTRNRLRGELLPALAADYNPQIVEALLRLSALAADAQQYIVAQAQQLAEHCVTFPEPDWVSVSAAPLAAAPRHLVREMLMAVWRQQDWPLVAMGHNEWTLLAELATDSTPRKRVFPGEVTADRTADKLLLHRA